MIRLVVRVRCDHCGTETSGTARIGGIVADTYDERVDDGSRWISDGYSRHLCDGCRVLLDRIGETLQPLADWIGGRA